MATENTDNTDDLEAELEQDRKQERKRREALDKKISDAEVEGWKLSKEEGDRAIMKKPNYGSFGGHLLVALLTVWWTLGIGNLCYAAYKYFNDSGKRVLRVDSV